MQITLSGKALRILALSSAICLGFSFDAALAQPSHTYAPPSPQRYQQRPDLPPGYDPSYSDPVSKPATDQQQQQQAQPATPATGSDAVSGVGGQVLDFLHQHMVASFICMLLIAPLWAMTNMRREEK
jgi:hypothetical protein